MRRFTALAVTGLVAASVLVPLSVATPADAATTPSVRVSLIRMKPWTPAPTKTNEPISFTVRLHNTTSSDLHGVTLTAGRAANPAYYQSQLDASLSSHSLPSTLQAIPSEPVEKSTIDIPASGSTEAVFRTTSTTSTPCDLCLYANAVYPIYLSAVDLSGAVLGFTRTYIASTDGAHDVAGRPLHKVDVSWIWPLIDAPHRLADARVFTDRTLPSELTPTGRLTRALQVVRDVGRNHQITLVIDPELVDELAILSTGRYSYLSSSGTTTRGTKVAAAASWLSTLRQVLTYPEVHPDFTPYADPDIESLSNAGLSWRYRIPPTMLKRIQVALGTSAIPSTLSWPPGGALTPNTLSQIASNGSTSLLLNRASVRPSNVAKLPASAATLRSSNGPLTAALTSSDAQNDVAGSIRDDRANNLSHLPFLLAELAIRASRQPYVSRAAFLSPPRYVDPDVEAAVTVIRATTESPVSTSASLQVALDQALPRSAQGSRPRHLSNSTPALSPSILAAARQVATSLPELHGLLTGPQQSAPVAPLLADLGRGLQHVESGAYLSTSTISRPATGVRLAGQLRRRVQTLLQGVYIVRPESGKGSYSYTLASTNSPLPITVDNTLPYRVFVHIHVSTVGDAPGLKTTDLGVRPVAANSKQTFRVPTYVSRSGNITLAASLTTPGGGYTLGPPVRLSVHSTVVGKIGIVITVAAAVVLFLALAVRYIRRLQRLRRKRRASSGDARVPARIA